MTGKNGQLAASLVEAAALVPGVELVTVGRPEFELTDAASVTETILAQLPDIVVSAAAYTSVDRAEFQQDLAYEINVTGAALVAEAAAMLGVPVIHLSTDYVFSGTSSAPYREDDEPGPKTFYGYSKLRGEHAVAGANPLHVILRTSWVYSPFGHNFARTMLRLAKERETIDIVADQWGNPTSALALAAAVMMVSTHPGRTIPSIYHVAGTGETNWANLARYIFQVSRAYGGPSANVRDITTAEYRTPAPRPLHSALCCDKFESVFDWRAPPWQESVETVVRRIIAEEYGHVDPEESEHLQ
ncbi:dTDP-4-dehydrorhamnose reductase [Pararhizobium capsulatum DSM 1112]|uniref:dTDP-4-dehydrorhamnose reductase n=1 Tax=Pararhizobium capsulatum DSM 1112 TaxID=1121113 RepID=A0ABU0BX16_9HYPH|nr:dTDP-4-dehydrorhamnose reductase [Pararhizobium capsulatum]MDQ0322191.1 dTDP-4-dehydrorhamnose reductase [Pararhizobium capsulatum DSM 1112]